MTHRQRKLTKRRLTKQHRDNFMLKFYEFAEWMNKHPFKKIKLIGEG